MEYYYYSYTIKRKDDGTIEYCDGVCKGSISNEILRLKEFEREDTYYYNYTVIFYKEITMEEFDKLDGWVG